MPKMKKLTGLLLVTLLFTLFLPETATAVRVRVRHRGRRTTVVVHRGFPIRRTLPMVVIRPPVVAVRVAPAVFLPPVVFGAVVLSAPPARDRQVWEGDEDLDREDGWTEFTKNIDKRGSQMILHVEKGAAEISFAEVVFENGEVQVVDFDDRVHAVGLYSLLDFRDGRKVDHVRVVAKAATNETEITLRLLG
jgi:hypothetical protein